MALSLQEWEMTAQRDCLRWRRAGAKTIGQNEASCIVYGMPKAAYDIGAVQQQAELTQIAQKTYDCLETVR